MGFLLLEGGAEFGGDMREPDLKAIELAGGFDAPIRILPTAAAPDHNDQRAGNNGIRWFQRLGARDVLSVPILDRASANDEKNTRAFRATKLIYLLGGFTHYLGQTLKGSLAWQAALVNDFGILLNVPVIKLINEDLLLPIDGSLNGTPTFNFSLGYSKSNIGDKISYVDFAQADPLPRMDRLGYGISTGFDLVSDNFRINAFNLSFTVEADDILVQRDTIGNSEYQSTLSDLKFWKNVILIEGDDKIVSHAGTKLDFVETVSLYFGHFSGRGFDMRETNGYEIRAKGLLKLCALWAKDPITDFLRDHIDIRYHNTDYFDYHPLQTKMTGPTEHRPGFVEFTGSQTVPAVAGSLGALHCDKR